MTLGVIMTLLVGYAGGAAFAAVLKSDVERLKEQILTLPERLARLEEKMDYTIELLRNKQL